MWSNAFQQLDNRRRGMHQVVHRAAGKHQQQGGAENHKRHHVPHTAVQGSLRGQNTERHNGKYSAGQVAEAADGITENSVHNAINSLCKVRGAYDTVFLRSCKRRNSPMPEESVATGWVVYLVRTAAGSLYCGVTSDMERRFP